MQTKTNANVGLMADSVDHIARLGNFYLKPNLKV